MSITRRSFLKAGLFGALALAAAGGVYRTFKSPEPLLPFALDAQGHAALTAICGAMIGSAMPPAPDASERAVEHTLEAIAGLPLATQKEVQDLFALLTMGVTRHLLTGVPDDWAQAKRGDVAAFLQSWRVHRLSLLQSGYHALHDLILGGWYADESTWADIGYPGPMKELST